MATLTHDAPFRPALVLPTYNNAGTLADILDRSLRLGMNTYVIDDGSSDATSQVLQQRRPDSRLRVLSHTVNQGKAAAMRTGFAAALADGCTHAATIDTDGQLDPEESKSLIDVARCSPGSLVLGCRAAQIDRYPASNRLGRRLANWFIWLECGVRVSDSQCGLRVYPLSMLAIVPARSGRYGFETEIITRAGWAGTPVVEVPVSCQYFQGDERVTHFRPLIDTIRAIGLHAFLLGRRLLPLSHTKWPSAPLEQKAFGPHDTGSASTTMPFPSDPGVMRVAE